MFDCVQFPRRGWVHRNKLPLASGDLDWLTLPIEKCSRDTRIADLQFAHDARARLAEQVLRFPLLAQHRADPFVTRLLDVGGNVADYLVAQVAEIAGMLGSTARIMRSSELAISPELHAQDRVIAIVREMGATHYVNPPGGRELYDPATFAKNGITLRFLTPHAGSNASILARLIVEDRDSLAAEIAEQTVLVA